MTDFLASTAQGKDDLLYSVWFVSIHHTCSACLEPQPLSSTSWTGCSIHTVHMLVPIWVIWSSSAILLLHFFWEGGGWGFIWIFKGTCNCDFIMSYNDNKAILFYSSTVTPEWSICSGWLWSWSPSGRWGLQSTWRQVQLDGGRYSIWGTSWRKSSGWLTPFVITSWSALSPSEQWVHLLFITLTTPYLFQ